MNYVSLMINYKQETNFSRLLWVRITQKHKKEPTWDRQEKKACFEKNSRADDFYATVPNSEIESF